MYVNECQNEQVAPMHIMSYVGVGLACELRRLIVNVLENAGGPGKRLTKSICVLVRHFPGPAFSALPVRNVMDPIFRQFICSCSVVRESKTIRHIVYYFTFTSATCQPVADNAGRRHLRSAARGDLAVPATRTLRYGPRSFAVAGPSTWNSLPAPIRSCHPRSVVV